MNSFKNEWVELLVDEDETNAQRFLQIYEEREELGRAIVRFRRELFGRGRGNVPLQDIENAYNNNEVDKFKELLGELFLEHIHTQKIKDIMGLMKTYKIKIKDVYDMHNEDKNCRIGIVLNQLM